MHTFIQSLIDGAELGGAYAIAGLCFSLLYQVTRVFHFAFAAIGALGSFVAVGFAGPAGGVGRIVVGVVLGILVGGAATAVVYITVYTPLTRRGADAATKFVASLGINIVLTAIVLLLFGGGDRTFSVTSYTRQRDVLGYGVSALDLTVYLTTVGMALLFRNVLGRTRVGHRMRAYISNPEQAALVGIRTGFLATGACVVLGGLSVISFVFVGMNSTIVLGTETQITLFAILAMIVGGVGSLAWTAVVGVLLGMVDGAAGTVIPGQWSTVVVFALAVLAILARPQGIAPAAGGLATQ